MPAAVVLVAAGASGLTAAVGSAVASAIVGGAVSATVATAVGTAVISGAITAAQGGSTSDILKSAVLGGVTAGVGASISASIASDVAFQSIANGVSGTTAVAMGNVLGSAAAGAITSGLAAGLSGRDPVEALIRGGLTAGLSSGVSSAVDAVFQDIPGFGTPSSNIEVALQRATKGAVATSILGGSGTDEFKNSLIQSANAIGTSYLGEAFRDLSGEVKALYERAKNSEFSLKSNVDQQQEIVDSYNSLAGQINSRYSTVEAARRQYDEARAKYDESGGAEHLIPAVNRAAENYNQIVEGYNNFYTQNIGKITEYQNRLGALKNQFVDLEKDYVTSVDSFKGKVSEFSTQEAKNAALVKGLIGEIDDASETYEDTFGRAPTTEEIKKLAATGDIDGSTNKLTANLNTLSPEQKSRAVDAVKNGDIDLGDAVDNTPLDWLKLPSIGPFPDVVITGKKEPGWEHTVDDRGYTLMWNEGKGLIQLYDEKDNLLHNWTDQFKYDKDGNVVGRGLDYYLSSAQDSFLRSSNQVAALIGDVLPAMAAKAVGNETYFNRQMSEAKSTLDRINRDYPSRVASYKNVNDISSAATYVLESVVEGVVTTAPTLLMGGPAGVAARASAKAAMDAAIKRELAVQASKGVFGAEAIQAAQAAATKAGLEVAAKFTTPAILAASAAQNVPEVFKNVYDAKQGKVDLKDVAVSTLVGGFNAALDSVLPSAIVDRLNLSKIPVEQVIGAWYKNAAKEAGSAFVREGGTEALQEMSSAAAESFLAENKQFFTKENLDRFIDAGVKGGLGGSAISTAFVVGKDALSSPTSDDILSQGLDKTTPAEYLAASQMLKDAGFNATVKDISAITGAGPEVLGGELQAQVDAYMDPRVVKESEAIQAFKDLGYTDPTPEEISAFIGQRDQASTLSDLSKQYDPLATTVDEARQMMRDLGYTNFTDAEAMSLAGKIKEAEAQKNVEEYVNPRQFTRAEAEQYFRDLGYTPTEQELTQFIRSGPEVMESAVKSELGTYVDPLVVDEQEVRDVLASLGFPDATDAQIKSLTGQYAEAKLAGLAEENLPQFMYNALKEQNNQLRQQIGTQARAANQADIDALSQMIAGQQAVDLTYDVTGDKQITQADLDYLRSVVTGSSPDWVAPAGTVWGGTGLQGQLAQAEAQRQRDAAAQQAAAKEAERRSAIRSAAGQAGAQVQQIIGQLPEAMKGLQTTTTPIYGGEINPFDLSAPLDVNFFSPSKEKQGSQTGQQTTKIATGGYLDDLLDLLR